MILQIIIGTILVCFTVVGTTAFIASANALLAKALHSERPDHPSRWFIFALSLAVLWMLTALTLAVWIWAGVFMFLDQFQTFEAATYFSVLCFTTLGVVEGVVDQQWRLLAGILAANGFILFSVVTAFLIDFYSKCYSVFDATKQSSSIQT